jgi:hypothetical protein
MAGHEALEARVAALEWQVAVLMEERARHNDPPAPYDPESETDPFLQEWIVDRPGNDRGPVLRHDYRVPVASVVRNLTAPGGGWHAVRASWPNLPEQAIAAAQRFGEKYPALVAACIEAGS